MASPQIPKFNPKPRKRSWSKVLPCALFDIFNDRGPKKPLLIENQGPSCANKSPSHKSSLSQLSTGPLMSPPFSGSDRRTPFARSFGFYSMSKYEPLDIFSKLNGDVHRDEFLSSPLKQNKLEGAGQATDLEEETQQWLASLAIENKARRQSDPSSSQDLKKIIKKKSLHESVSPLSSLTPKIPPVSPHRQRRDGTPSNESADLEPESSASRGRKFRGKPPCSICIE